jgi:hypothetical protein
MSEEKIPYKVELISLEEIADRPQMYLMHLFKPPAIQVAKLGGSKAIEILKNKPGGTEVIAELQKRGKLKDLKPNPGDTIGYSEPTSGDPWSAFNAEIGGPNVTRVMFCCMTGVNGIWQSRFKMPAKDDLMAMVHVSGGHGAVSATLDGVLLGNHPFSGNDWIVVLVSDLVAGWHTFKITQESGYFQWLSTEYIRL